jgi:hypothetical protein
MKKNVFLGLLVILLVFNFFGCGDDSNENKEFTVTFDLDGGNINGNTTFIEIIVKSGEIITNFPEPLKINGYLNGWFTGKNGVGNEFTITTKILSNQIVYAKWINPFIGEWKHYIIYSNNNVFDQGFKHVFFEDMTFILYQDNAPIFKGTYSFIGSEFQFTYTHSMASGKGEWEEDNAIQEWSYIIIDSNKIELYENGIDIPAIWEKI